VSKETGELEVLLEQARHHQLPQMEGISQFCQAVKWKNKNVTCYNQMIVAIVDVLTVIIRKYKYVRSNCRCDIQDDPPSCCLRSNAVVVSMMCRHLVVYVATPLSYP
jgi:hypothetical protein